MIGYTMSNDLVKKSTVPKKRQVYFLCYRKIFQSGLGGIKIK